MEVKEKKEFTNKDKANELINNVRGHLVLSQALFLAIDSMNRRTPEGEGSGEIEREPSNLADMKLLYKEIFNIYSPKMMLPMQSSSVEDIEEHFKFADKLLKDTLDGTYVKNKYMYDDIFKDAIINEVFNQDESSKFYYKKWEYLETDKDGYDHFVSKKNKGKIKNKKGVHIKERFVNKVINLNDIRKKKND